MNQPSSVSGKKWRMVIGTVLGRKRLAQETFQMLCSREGAFGNALTTILNSLWRNHWDCKRSIGLPSNLRNFPTSGSLLSSTVCSVVSSNCIHMLSTFELWCSSHCVEEMVWFMYTSPHRRNTRCYDFVHEQQHDPIGIINPTYTTKSQIRIKKWDWHFKLLLELMSFC